MNTEIRTLTHQIRRLTNKLGSTNNGGGTYEPDVFLGDDDAHQGGLFRESIYANIDKLQKCYDDIKSLFKQDGYTPLDRVDEILSTMTKMISALKKVAANHFWLCPPPR